MNHFVASDLFDRNDNLSFSVSHALPEMCEFMVANMCVAFVNEPCLSNSWPAED